MRLKKQTSFSLSTHCLELLDALKLKVGLSETAIIEMLVREFADSKGVRTVSVQDSTETVISDSLGGASS